MASIKRIGKDKHGIPVWDAVYRRTKNGKQIHRRIHALTRQDAERQIALDSGRPDISLKWSEGLKIYVAAKHAEKRNPVAIAHGERAVAVFTQLIGDIPIEATDTDTFKHFLQLTERPSATSTTRNTKRKAQASQIITGRNSSLSPDTSNATPGKSRASPLRMSRPSL